jgi:hypothetical protein
MMSGGRRRSARLGERVGPRAEARAVEPERREELEAVEALGSQDRERCLDERGKPPDLSP